MNGELNEINPLIGVLGEPDDLYGSLDGPLTRGYSAYEIYLEHGGTMTVEEWLASLKGEKGDEPSITTQRTGSKQTTIYADGEQIGIILDGQDGDPGEPGDDGFSPTVETAAITGGHSVTITDASGPHTFNVMDGQDGAPGRDGQPGADGYSPSASVTKSGKTATISITDKSGTTTATVSDGQDGQDGQDGSDGYTPVKGTDYWTASDKAEMEQDVAEDLIADEYDPDNGTYEVGDLCTKDGALYRCKTAITTAEAWNASHWRNVKIADVTSSLFGDLSEKVDKVSNATSGNFAGLDANGNLTDSGKKASDFLETAPVTDVQVNSTSVLNQGVANIPIADLNNFGVMKINSNVGFRIDSTGYLRYTGANASLIKAGTDYDHPLMPERQHESTFYGLAKAAGDSTQSASSNAVGNYTEEAKTAIQTMLGVPSADDTVSDVTVNGTSIVSDGVANVPIANSSTFGVAKYNYVNGVGIDANGVPMVSYADSEEVKSGRAGTRKPITPSNQHESAFYALAKAAGDTTQSASSNAVGTYTDSAKVAIQKMLGIYEAPWELIRADSFTNETVANYEISVDGNGNAFELTDVRVVFWLPKQEVASSAQGRIYFYYTSYGYYDVAYCGSWTQAANANSRGMSAQIIQKDKMIEVNFVKNTEDSSDAPNLGTNRFFANIETAGQEALVSRWFAYVPNGRVYTKIAFTNVLGTGNYVLFGKRKWS